MLTNKLTHNKKKYKMEKNNISVPTYIVKSYDGNNNYDSNIPIELVEIFQKLTSTLKDLSNGKYDCSPLVFDPNQSQGVLVGIFETKENNTIKLPFYLSIK